MKQYAISAVAIALLTGTAFAATDIGVITKVDPKSDAVTLADGKTFTLAEGTEAESLKVGEKIEVTFNMKGGKMIATKVAVAK